MGLKVTLKEECHRGVERTLEKGLGDAYTPEVESAWTETYTLLAGAMKEGAAA